MSSNAAQGYALRVKDVDRTLPFLPPVTGIKNTPLSSIADATRPLWLIVNGLEQGAIYAKEFADRLLLTGPDPHGLTCDEIAAIYLYTLEFIYAVLNRALRSVNRKQCKPYFPYLRLLLNGLEKLPAYAGTVYRGVKLDLSEVYRVGEETHFWAFSSATQDGAVLEDESFLGSVGDRSLLCIDQMSGRDVSRYSAYQSEKEMLLLPGYKYRIMNCTALPGSSGFRLYNLKQMPGQSALS